MHEARHTQVNPKQRQHTKAALEISLVCGKYILKYKGFVNWGVGGRRMVERRRQGKQLADHS